jgi:hypothetical protein
MSLVFGRRIVMPTAVKDFDTVLAVLNLRGHCQKVCRSVDPKHKAHLHMQQYLLLTVMWYRHLDVCNDAYLSITVRFTLAALFVTYRKARLHYLLLVAALIKAYTA